MMERVRRMIIGVAILALLPAFGAAQDLSVLQRPGVVALMRHALAPGTGDPPEFELGDCTTQRNLDSRGRAQATRIGEAIRAADVTFDHVWTSQWCRARDTAELLQLGNVVEVPPLNSFFAGRGDRAAQTDAIMGRIKTLPRDARVLLVTHQVNITALSGARPGSGEIVVTRRDGAGGLEVVGRVRFAP